LSGVGGGGSGTGCCDCPESSVYADTSATASAAIYSEKDRGNAGSGVQRSAEGCSDEKRRGQSKKKKRYAGESESLRSVFETEIRPVLTSANA